MTWSRLDRASIAELLGRLGAENDEAVVAAACELHRKVSESGLNWDDLLRPESNTVGAGADAERNNEPLDETSADDTPADDNSVEVEGEFSTADKAEAARLIGRLLAHKNLSTTMREDLADLKRTIADGSFDAMDSRYIRALAKRLGA